MDADDVNDMALVPVAMDASDTAADSSCAAAADVPKCGARLVQGDILIDALPYFDQGYEEPGVRDAAMALIEEEMERYRPTRNYLDYISAPDYHLFETELMKNEFERLENRLPMETLSMKRYDLPPPVAGKLTDVGAWSESVENSQSQLEHQALRIVNLQCLEKMGAAAYKANNDTLSGLIGHTKRDLQNTRQQTQEINWARKKRQETTGEDLKLLEETWVALVAKNYELETACSEMQAHLEHQQNASSSAE